MTTFTTTTTTTTATPTPPTITSTERGVLTSIRLIKEPDSTFRDDISNHKNFGLLNDKDCGKYNPPRISGGREAELHQFPWLGLLQYRTRDDEKMESFKCSGTLITNNTVLTAAHCIQMQSEEL